MTPLAVHVTVNCLSPTILFTTHLSYQQNFIQGTTMNEQISLFLIWMDTLMRQQSNLIAADRKLTKSL